MSPTTPDTADLTTLLAAHKRPWWRRGSLWLLLVLLLAAGAGFWAWRNAQREAAQPRFITQPITRGNLAVTITATGALQPTRSVAVGSELSGTVSRVLVDVNDPVKKGQLLVELDRAKLADTVAGARAEVAAARARLQQAEVTLTESRASLARLNEVNRLSGGKLPAAADLDTARATADRAAADRASAAASVSQSEATLRTQETNLAKAAIRSPIDGVVLARNVEPGNAVAASLQAVTLFTLAEDLKSMKLSVNVDEADVAQVKEGQHATFTVASQPGRNYPAAVARVAYGSTTTDNVITYTTELEVDNSDLSLRPGMTATATIATTERNQVLLAPNSALRFSPASTANAGSGSGAAAGGGGSGGGGIVGQLMPRPPGMGQRRAGGGGGAGGGSGAHDGNSPREATLWLLQNGQPVALKVHRGLSDGRFTEVSGNGLTEGAAVIVDQAANAR